MKEGWEVVPMGQLCSISSGESDTQDSVIDGPYAFFDRSKTVKRSMRFLYDCEALIIPGEGKEFFPKHFEGKFDLHQRAYALFGFIPTISVRFLFHLFHHRSDYFPSVAVGATVKSLRRRHFENFPVPVPPLSEQHRIVEILDKAFADIAKAKANAEQNLRNARELFESQLNEVFTKKGEGWVEKTIGDCVRFIDYRGKTPAKTMSGLRLITAKNVKMGILHREPEEFVAPESYDAWMTRGIPRKGDVLFTTEAPLANVAQLDTAEKVVFAQRVIIMQPDPAWLDSTFLKFMLLSKPVQERIHAKGTGATVKGIKASLLKTIEIFFPGKRTEQTAIVAQLDALSFETQRLALIYERKLEELEALKKSILHRAFSGEL